MPVNIDEGERLLKPACGANRRMSEVEAWERWKSLNGMAMLAELRDSRVAAVKLSDAVDAYRDAVNEFCDVCCERKVRQFMGAESVLLAARDELDRLIPITQARDAGEGGERGE